MRVDLKQRLVEIAHVTLTYGLRYSLPPVYDTGYKRNRHRALGILRRGWRLAQGRNYNEPLAVTLRVRQRPTRWTRDKNNFRRASPCVRRIP